jgi:hypothetical protein
VPTDSDICFPHACLLPGEREHLSPSLVRQSTRLRALSPLLLPGGLETRVCVHCVRRKHVLYVASRVLSRGPLLFVFARLGPLFALCLSPVVVKDKIKGLGVVLFCARHAIESCVNCSEGKDESS